MKSTVREQVMKVQIWLLVNEDRDVNEDTSETG
jgi:hypothetical protein